MMNWNNLPEHIIEKIVFYAVKCETKVPSRSNEWLLAVNDFAQSRWQNAVFSSKLLIPPNKSTLIFDPIRPNQAKRLTEAGFLSVVESIFIGLPDALFYIRDYIEGNSLTKVSFVVDTNWTDGSLELLVEILRNIMFKSVFI